MVWKPDGGDGTEVGKTETVVKSSVDGSVGTVEVVFSNGFTQMMSQKFVFGGKINHKGCGRGLAKLAESSKCFVTSEDRVVIDFNNVGTTKFVISGFQGRVELGSATVSNNFGNKGTVVEIIRGKSKTKCGVWAGDRKWFGDSGEEGTGANDEWGDCGVIELWRKLFTILCALKMDHIGWRIVGG